MRWGYAISTSENGGRFAGGEAIHRADDNGGMEQQEKGSMPAGDPRIYFAGMRRGFAAGFALVFGAALAVTVDARLTFGVAAGFAAGDLRVLAAAA